MAYLLTTPQPLRRLQRQAERLVECFLRHAIGNHIFTEYLPGHVQHTASSSLLATDPYLKDAIAMMSKEIWQCATRVTDMVRRFRDSGEPTKAPFTLVNEPGVGMWEHLAKHPERANRFGGAMKVSVLWKAGVWRLQSFFQKRWLCTECT